MKILLHPAALLFFIISMGQNSFSQCVPLPTLTIQNPSFEGTPQAHVTPGPWTNCQPSQTPDTQPGSWGINMPPTNGSSYLGLVHQATTGWQEGAAGLLSSPMTAGTFYTFTIDLANVQTSDPGIGIDPGCAECQIWGGNNPCDFGELLWQSGNITPYDTWQNYTVSFTPSQNWPYIAIYINSLGCTDGPYILVDNMSPIVPPSVAILTTTIDQGVACPGMSNGEATVHAAGQYLPFSYNWNSTPPQTDSNLTNVPAGTYSVTVTDANTCTATASIAITEPQPIILTPTVIDATCFNAGSAYMSYAGGTQPFTFLWSNGPTTQNNGNIFAGTYNITATDANACTATASITISSLSLLTVTGAVTNPTCTMSGSISASAASGNPPYSYVWNTVPPQNTATATNLGGGTYIVTATDAGSCTATASFNVPPPLNSPAVSLTPVDAQCFGQSNGSINSSVSGGNPGYTYSWSTAPVQATPNATGVPAGTYTLLVTDANSCTVSASANVSEPTALTASTAKTDVLCFGQNTGSATVTATGGTSGYTYSWNSNPVQTTAAATGLAAGNFSITVTDANACSISSSVVVNQPASPVTLSETHVDVLCFGGNTGSATVTAVGGTSGYTYSWNTNPAQSTATASSLTAGTYTVTVNDVNSCSASISSVISQPSTAVSVTATLTAPTCFGQPLASAIANASGGTAAYSYSWNTTPVQNTQNISNISPGNYTVVATDANNCTASATITVAAPPTQLVLTTSHTDVLCFGNATGTATVVANGSYGGYSYNWNTNPVQTTTTATQLIAGSYNITVTDVQGCSASAIETVLQPGSALSIATSKTDVLCFGNATGTATGTATGGTAGYNYAWGTTPVQATATVISLIAGTYNVTVADNNGCSQTATETVTQPTQLTATQNSLHVTCNGAANGSISITASGGTIAYSYQWSTVPSVDAPDATGLPPGNYTVTVTDANNCSTSVGTMTITEPTALTVSTSVTDVSCPGNNDGSIAASVAGSVPPYTYLWSNANTNAVNSNLAGGAYNVLVTDDNGCTISANNIIVAELPAVALSGIVTNIPCAEVHNGAVDITASSSFPPLSFIWSTGSTSEDLTALNAGTCSVTVTDTHGCSADSDFEIVNNASFSINATPDTVVINLGQTVDLNVSAIGSSFGSVLWTPSNGLNCSDCVNPTSSAIESIAYFVTGTDVNGCIATDVVHVTVVPKYTIFIPNAFTPNGDGNNDFFETFGNKEAWKQFSVEVFDRWGEKIYESSDMNFKWDGTYKGKPLNPSVLVYLVKLVYLDNYTEKLHTGTVTLIR